MPERSSSLRLIIDSSDARQAARDLDRFADEADRAERETDDLRDTSDRTSAAMRGLGTAVKAVVAALAVREVLQFADAFQQAQNRLRLVTSSTEELIRVQEELQAVSQRTFNTFQGTADLYSRLALSTQDLGVSSERLLGITETINQAVALSGTSAQAANAALFQLGQGLGAGALRGEELNSILDQTTELARAIAEGLDVSTGELRKLGAEGALTAERILGALENQAQSVQERFQTLEPTIGQVGTVIREAFANALVEAFVDDLTDAGTSALQLRDTFETLGSVIGSAFSFALQRLQDLAGLIDEVTFQLEKLGLIKIDLEFNPESVQEVRDALQAVNTQIRVIQNQLTDGEGFAFSLSKEGLIGPNDPRRAAAEAELRALQSTAEELTAILTNSVTPATERLGVSLNEIEDGLSGVKRPVDDLADSAKKAAERLEALSGAAGTRGGFAAGIASGATTIQEFDRSIAPLFSDEAARQLANEIGVSIEQAQRALAVEEGRLREEFLDRQAAIFEGLPPAIDRAALSGTERGAREGVRDGLREGLGDFERTANDVEFFAQIGQNITGAIQDSIDLIRDPDASTSDKILGSVNRIGPEIADAIRLIPGAGPVAAALDAVSQVAGVARDVINIFKDLFGKQSNFTAQGVFNPVTGSIAGLAQDRGADENARARDEFIDSVSAVAAQLSALLGGASVANLAGTPANEAFLNVAVRSDRKTGQPFIDVGFQSPSGEPVGGGRFTDPQEAFDEAIRLTIQALQGGEDALLSYAKAAAIAGRGAEDIISGIEGLNAVMSLADEPLSQVEQALKQIDDVVNPVIEDLKSLGQSIEAIEQVARDAARAVGDAFIRDIQNDILSFRNAALGEFQRILDAQERLVSDAQALLDRGAITPAEFDLVQVRNALERENFFEGLSPDELEGLGDFFGLIENSGGSVAVILTQLTDAFSEFTDNVAETRDRLQQEADQLAGFAEQIFSTRDRIQLRFPSLSGGELLGDLRGQLGNLRERALAGDNTAFEQIPDLANRLVDLAREIFGATTDFANERDFALQVLDQTGNLAESRSDKLLTEIEALNSQVDTLNDIRNALESPDPAIDLIQEQLTQGNVTNDLLRQLLEQYIALTAEARAGQITPSEAQAASEGFLGVSGSGGTLQRIEIDRFDENIVLLSSVRNELRLMRADNNRLLESIRNEQRRSSVNATLTS